MKKSSKKNAKRTFDKYNKTQRVRLCEYSVTPEKAEIIVPMLDVIKDHHGSKVSAITAAIETEYFRVIKIHKKSEG